MQQLTQLFTSLETLTNHLTNPENQTSEENTTGLALGRIFSIERLRKSANFSHYQLMTEHYLFCRALELCQATGEQIDLQYKLVEYQIRKAKRAGSDTSEWTRQRQCLDRMAIDRENLEFISQLIVGNHANCLADSQGISATSPFSVSMRQYEEWLNFPVWRPSTHLLKPVQLYEGEMEANRCVHNTQVQLLTTHIAKDEARDTIVSKIRDLIRSTELRSQYAERANNHASSSSALLWANMELLVSVIASYIIKTLNPAVQTQAVVKNMIFESLENYSAPWSGKTF
jgi:hypothetical protein